MVSVHCCQSYSWKLDKQTAVPRCVSQKTSISRRRMRLPHSNPNVTPNLRQSRLIHNVHTPQISRQSTDILCIDWLCGHCSESRSLSSQHVYYRIELFRLQFPNRSRTAVHVLWTSLDDATSPRCRHRGGRTSPPRTNAPPPGQMSYLPSQ